jgi:hypothetical protein
MGIGRLLIITGVLLIVAGLLLGVGGKFGLGKLPGDIVVRRNNFSFYFPIATSLLLSGILTLAMWLFSKR